MTHKAKELIDSYVWEISKDGHFKLVKRTDQNPDKLHYDFLDLPNVYLSQVQVLPKDMLF